MIIILFAGKCRDIESVWLMVQDPSVLGEHHPHQFCFKALLLHQLLRLKQVKMAELLQDNLVNNTHI